MADQQATQTEPSATEESTSAAQSVQETVRLTGPGGTDYRLEMPESAAGREIAAITATVSAHLSAEAATETAPRMDDTSGDMWTQVNRHSVRSPRTRPRVSGEDGWRVAARCHR